MKCLDRKGFTLVEVMIASVVLFAAIVTGTAVFRSSARNAEKVSSALILARAMPFVVDLVKDELDGGNTSGHGKFDPYILYIYSSKVTKRSRNIISLNDASGKGIMYGAFDVFLVKVHLTIRYEGPLSSREESTDYNEVLWQPAGSVAKQ